MLEAAAGRKLPPLYRFPVLDSTLPPPPVLPRRLLVLPARVVPWR